MYEEFEAQYKQTGETPPPLHQDDAYLAPFDALAKQNETTPDEQGQQATEKPPEEKPAIEVPANIAEMREQDGPRRLYSPQNTYAEPIPDAMFDHIIEVAEPVRVGVVKELREISADLGLSVVEVASIRTRAAVLRENTPDKYEQRKETLRQLKSAFGDADAALRDARALVARDPRVGRLIEAMGLGDDAETLVMLIYAARRQRNAGRL